MNRTLPSLLFAFAILIMTVTARVGDRWGTIIHWISVTLAVQLSSFHFSVCSVLTTGCVKSTDNQKKKKKRCGGW